MRLDDQRRDGLSTHASGHYCLKCLSVEEHISLPIKTYLSARKAFKSREQWICSSAGLTWQACEFPLINFMLLILCIHVMADEGPVDAGSIIVHVIASSVSERVTASLVRQRKWG